ncbi:tyrosine-type DNA invertase cluster 3b [Bacteroides sp. GM023]|uniref:tyrosine-type DNA invertase cluster 3b n=1 Tax=Bacteroides sp. GM023 TaxID=2723058 RepID=UPI00168A677F|nr:tyrosine-type DNA invertase cluster 3b [Bacteroides sp. GM023]MBD3590194.1 tyrosine-type DNA invertase cluster 3b [Bacteroides sp. GM023]
MMSKNGFSRCGELYIGRLQKEGRFSTAHVYKNALLSFSKFCGTQNVSFRQVTRESLRRYGQHLSESGLKPNTVSTYMRMLRSVYNRGVEAGNAPYVPRLFRDVYTGVDIRQKRALPVPELHKLLYEDPKSDRLRRTQAIAALMFQFCGMSFADLAHMEKSALDQNILRYSRVKTKTPMSVEVLDTAKEMIDQLRNHQPSRPDYPDYLFDILLGDKKRKDERAYREYQSALRRFNNHLKGLAKALRLTSPVTSYTLRHSWATTAKYRGVSIEMISESLGHKSIKTTQIYLKGFELRERTEVNKMNLSYVKNCQLGRL